MSKSRTINGSKPQAGGETPLRVSGDGSATAARPGSVTRSSTGTGNMPAGSGSGKPASGK